jgi:hypothetical protein
VTHDEYGAGSDDPAAEVFMSVKPRSLADLVDFGNTDGLIRAVG